MVPIPIAPTHSARRSSELALDARLGGRYRVGPVLAHDGVGLTYAAVDERLARRVTVLVTDGPDPEVAEQARRRARVEHPGLVRVLAVLRAGDEDEAAGVAADATCVVRERLDGHPLGDELRTHRPTLSQAEVGGVLADVAAASRVAVEAGLGVVEPRIGDLYRTDDGRTVLDPAFGRQPTEDGPTRTVAALAALAHELLTGRAPALDAPPAWRVNPTVSRGVSDALTAAMADPGPDTLDALLAALGHPPDPTRAWRPATVDLRDDLTEVTVAAAPAAAPAVSTVVTAPVSASAVPVLPPPAPVQVHAPAPSVHAYAPAAPALVAPSTWDGSVPAGRRWVTVPLGLAGVVMSSAQPVLIPALLALVVAPGLATWGDLVSRGRSAAFAPWWVVRNTVIAAVRAFIPALVLMVGLLLWWGTGTFDGMDTVGRVLLRLTGVVVGLIVVSSISRGGPGFRSHLALDDLTRRLLPSGRPTLMLLPLLVVSALLVLAGVGFTPDAWPIGG